MSHLYSQSMCSSPSHREKSQTLATAHRLHRAFLSPIFALLCPPPPTPRLPRISLPLCLGLRVHRPSQTQDLLSLPPDVFAFPLPRSFSPRRYRDLFPPFRPVFSQMYSLRPSLNTLVKVTTSCPHTPTCFPDLLQFPVLMY